jgi:glycosyltransferase involved in cell wall biosynthesis
MKISIIIPTYNEEKTLLEILKKVNEQKKIYDLEIIVSDDSSTDKTKDLLLENKHLYDQVVFNKKNLGKGSAIINSLNVVTGDYILIQDADLEYDPSDYKRLLDPVLKDNADVVYGSRFQGSDPKRILYFSHRVANFILTFLVNILTNINFSDVETGYKLIKTSLIKDLKIKEKTFTFEIEITMKLAKKKIKIYEVGINYFGRTYEEGKKIGIKDGFLALYKIFYYKFFD